MANKKLRFTFFTLLLLSLVSAFFGLNFKTQPAFASTNEFNTAFEQNYDVSVTDIFENYTQTSLKQEYNDKSILDQLKQNSQISIDKYDRAMDVINGRAKFTSKREFSTKFENDNKIDQVGDIAKYSQDNLNCIWPTSELILTGIYGKPGYTFNVFVEANGTTDKLPEIMFSQNHGYYLHWYDTVQLKKGMNKLIFPTFGLKLVDEDEIIGGAIYLRNPYLPNEQGEVNVYIEGGGYYPVFRKGGNEKEFLNFLNEYETQRKTDNLLDMAELVTDHAIISTTSSSLYDVYFNNNVITPTENLDLWGNYFTQLFEFNGIPTSRESNLGTPYDPRNDYVKINFRYMTYYPGSGAYSYSYHIGWYYEHYWFANFYNAKNPIKDHGLSEHLIFGIGHELGHALDNEPRKINETTNNFTAAMAYFKIVGMPHYEQYQPFTKTLDALSNDYNLDYKAYDDGQIMYTKTAYPTNYDHNYLIWWDLEAVFPGFWARFNNYFRGPLKAGLNTTELYVYYSSLATGVDLSDYYERWGFYYGKKSDVDARFVYDNASKAFKDAMQEAENNQQISKQYDHFWYADGNQYNFILDHQNVPEADMEYKNGKPTITKILRANNGRTIFITSNKADCHLGYEVLSQVNNEGWKIAGFTYTSSFEDKNYYTSTPTYKVVAINRFFKASAESEPVSNVVVQSPYVCKVNDVFYNDLSTAISEAEPNSIVYLLNNCSVDGKYIVKDITLQIDDSVNNDIYIYNSGSQSMFVVQSNFTIIGKDNAKIIFDGANLNSGNPAVYGTSDKIVIKNANFRNLNTTFLAGAVYASGSDLEIYNTSFDACNSAKNDAAIYARKALKLNNCTFSNNFLDVYIDNLDNLTLANQTCKLNLGFEKFDDEKSISIEGDASEIAEKIELKTDGYMALIVENQIVVKPLSFKLKFHFNASIFEYEVKEAVFVLGDEKFDYNLTDKQYVEYEARNNRNKYKLGDKIILNNDMEFDVKIKNKLSLNIFYEHNQSLNYYTDAEEVYLPTIDQVQNKVFAYKDGSEIYNAGQIYVVEKDSSLVAIYEGNFVYRYIVRDEIYSVGYGVYGQSIELIDIEEDGFLGWQQNMIFVSGRAILKGDEDFVAVFSGETPEVYDLTKCAIQIDGSYTYSGENVVPNITVYYNGLVVPSECYAVSCSNNIAASRQAQVTISFVPGLSTGTKSQFFTINQKQLGPSDINVLGLQDFVYNGNLTAQNLTILYNSQHVETFSVEYIGDRTNAGKVKVKIAFFGNFIGEVYLEYTISKADHPIEMPQTNMTIGRKIKTLQSVKLIDGWQWENVNTKIDKETIVAYAVFSDKTNYTNYRVAIILTKEPPKDVANLSVSLENSAFVYDGSLKMPNVIAKDGVYILSVDTDFDVEYQNNKLAGVGKAIVHFKNDYKGTKDLAFTISKAKKPNVDTIIRLSKKAKTLADIPLPDGFVWEDVNIKITSNKITAKAIYQGSDKDCFETNELYFEIILEEQNQAERGFLIWVIIGLTVAAALITSLSVVIARHRRNSWWKKW